MPNVWVKDRRYCKWQWTASGWSVELGHGGNATTAHRTFMERTEICQWPTKDPVLFSHRPTMIIPLSPAKQFRKVVLLWCSQWQLKLTDLPWGWGHFASTGVGTISWYIVPWKPSHTSFASSTAFTVHSIQPFIPLSPPVSCLLMVYSLLPACLFFLIALLDPLNYIFHLGIPFVSHSCLKDMDNFIWPYSSSLFFFFASCYKSQLWISSAKELWNLMEVWD